MPARGVTPAIVFMIDAMVRRILHAIAVAALLASAASAVGQSAPITVDQLLAGDDVIVADGAPVTDDERARLLQAAQDLAAPADNDETFPTKFVLVPAPAGDVNLDAQAAELHRAAIERLGTVDRLDAVILLAPRAIGIAANAFPSEIEQTLNEFQPQLTRDRVAGAVAIASRLKELDVANLLPGEDLPSQEVRGRGLLLWVSAAIIALIGVIGVIASRRAAKDRDRRQQDAEDVAARAADDGAPPPELRQ